MKQKNPEDESFVNSYFLCKITNELIEFKGFKDEKLIIALSDLSNVIELENNQIYYFEKLKKEANDLYFVKNKSRITKSNRITIEENNISLKSSEPYSFIGKIIKKEEKQLILLTSLIKIVILVNIGDNFENCEENQFIYVSCAEFSSEKEGIIYFKFHSFSIFKKLDEIQENNPIKHKVAIRFNLLDYKGMFNNNNDIMIKQIGLELSNDNIIKFNSDKKNIFYVYDANNYDYDYFPQIVYLYCKNGTFLKLKFFVYKGFLNEANIFIRQQYSCAYEFLYFSIDNSLPKKISVRYQSENKYETSELQTFGSKIRKRIVFMNIPPQDKNDIKNENSFLNIYLCKKDDENKKDKIKLYGTFSLNSIKFKDIETYIYKPIITDYLMNIYQNYKSIAHKKENLKNFFKYFSFNEVTCQDLRKEMDKNFYLIKLENNEFTLNYFNSLSFWNYCNFIFKEKYPISKIKDYINLYEKLITKNNISYVEKSMILVGFVLRVFEDEINFSCPKLFFYEDLDDNNPYKVAYNFQFNLIKNISEESCLFQPFLFLDSFIMDCHYGQSFYFIKTSFKSAYSISMLSIESIKDHLKKSIKNYFFVLEKQGIANKRKYYASVQKCNRLITYNENILLQDSKFSKIYELDEEDIFYNPKIINNFAFILNLENLHENFSHNKENLLNIKESPTLFFNRDLNISYMFHYDTDEFGEAGKLVEDFICGKNLIDYIKKTKYEMGDFLDIKYFIDKDFNNLIKGFGSVIQLNEENKINEEINIQENYKDSSTNSNLLKNIHDEEESRNEFKIDNTLFENNFSENLSKIKEEGNNLNNKKEEKIFLSKHNTYIISAETIEELYEKVNEMEKNRKNIIKSEDAIENNNDICDY